MQVRHQLAVYSPITIASLARAVPAALGLVSDPRPLLLDYLLREYSADAGLLCGSGTQALQVAITAALSEVGRGESVALPAFSCFDVASAAIGADARVSLYDIDPATLSPDLDSFERTLANGARVAVVAPLYGMPVDWETLERLASKFDAILIEDAAQGNGAEWRGTPVGALGRISTLSFGRGKGWTGGHGGAVLVRGGQELPRVELARAGARGEAATIAGLTAQWAFGRPSVYGIPRAVPWLHLGETSYRPPVVPHVLDCGAAAALLSARDQSKREAARRRETARVMSERTEDLSSIRPIVAHKPAVSGFLRFPVRLPDGLASLADPSRALRLGIAPTYPDTLSSLNPLAKLLCVKPSPYPGARCLVRELVTLPTHSLLRAEEREEILSLLSV